MDITDLVGEEIKLGSMIAFNSGGNTNLKIAIVTEIHSELINYPVKHRKALYSRPKSRPKSKKGKVGGRIATKRTFLGWSNWKIRNSYLKIDFRKEIQGRIIVIKNPLFLLDNPEIAAQLEIMDLAKDAGFLPKDYELGVSFEQEDLNERAV